MDSCCPSAYNCTDVVYEVHDAKNQLVAHVTKHWGGGAETCKGKFNNIWLMLQLKLRSACCLECYNANTFVIDFEAKQTTREKIGLLGATLLIVSQHPISIYHQVHLVVSPNDTFFRISLTTNSLAKTTENDFLHLSFWIIQLFSNT